ncbi:hypothetical protein [Alishewanella phage vB_AspM_Slickus01]|nr:hypothetical protein [Alishewanella phage vB_AspM_Slickus01]
MSDFLNLLKESLEQIDDILVESVYDILEQYEFSDDELEEILESSDLDDHEHETVVEALQKTVNFKGKVKRRATKKIRTRRASLTTGMSKLARKLRARKANKTKRRNPSIKRIANRRRKKAMRIRKQRGIK